MQLEDKMLITTDQWLVFTI